MVTKSKESKRYIIQTVLIGRVRSTSGGFSVYDGRAEDGDRIVVKQWTGPVASGQRWVVCGRPERDPRWGDQFVAQFACLARPTNTAELEAFLTSGHIDGWTWRNAGAVLEAFPDPVNVIEHESYKLLDVPTLTPELIQALQDVWARGAGLAQVYARLDSWGVKGMMADKLVKQYGADAARIVGRDPYQPIFDVKGYGWKTAESIARGLTDDPDSVPMAPDDPRRMRAGLTVAVLDGTFKAGHTWLTRSELLATASSMLLLDMQRIGAYLDAGSRVPQLVQIEDKTYPAALYAAEQAIADSVAQRLALDPLVRLEGHWWHESGTVLTDEQWDGVKTALTNRVALLTGGPGVGKTSTIATLIRCAQKAGLQITLMAPTGKAARRMTEATGYPASTIHSRLKIVPGTDDLDGPDLADGEDDTVRGMVIIDEVSMLDTQIAACVFRRVSMDAHILLVGDPDQLPSVGPGAVLRDLIDAGICPQVHLSRVFRNDAGIAVQAARIRSGQALVSLPDCQLLEAATPEDAGSWICETVQTAYDRGAWKPEDVLILTPTNKGASGRHMLNSLLQEALNDQQAGNGVQIKRDTQEFEIRLGDRVMVNRNDKDLGVFNGEIGTVIDTDGQRAITVRIDDRDVVFVKEDKQLLDLAYAITGHKSQGSEAPIVIIPVFPGMVLSREWLYTVITRGKRQVYLIGDLGAMQSSLRIQRTYDRRTTLVPALAERFDATVQQRADDAADHVPADVLADAAPVIESIYQDHDGGVLDAMQIQADLLARESGR